MPDYSKFGKKTSHGSLDPDMTLADAAKAIPNGAKETWLDILRRLMCFPLHITACNLFSTKWVEICNTVGAEEEVSIAVKHFKDQWLQERLRYWYPGASRGHVLHNSGLEGMHGVVKDEATCKSPPVLHYKRIL